MARRGGTIGFMAEDAVPTSDVFLDERGSLLRVRWDDQSQQLEITVWREGVCVTTHRLDHTDTARLSSLLTQAWIDGLRRSTAEAE
jgi:hypothetical protein